MNGHKLSWITLYSIAMGYMEAVIVVYLRKIYYPDGFRFPVVPIDRDILLFEFFREAATIIMLLSIGILTMKRAAGKFAVFIYCFAIWDIFYYGFLKIMLDWPESFLVPDLLFLIPVPWTGPVMAPCLVSLTMIILALVIFYFNSENKLITIQLSEWLIYIMGSFIIILSFMWDYLKFISKNGLWQGAQGNHDPLAVMADFIPGPYNWVLFISGELIILTGIIRMAQRIKRN